MVWGVNNVAALKEKTPKNLRVRSIIASWPATRDAITQKDGRQIEREVSSRTDNLSYRKS